MIDWAWPHLWGLAPLALAPLVLGLWSARRGRRVPAAAIALECLALLGLVAGLAGPAVRWGGGGPVAVFRDVSGSLGSAPAELPWPEGRARREYVFADGVAPAGLAVSTDRTRLGPVLALLAEAPEPWAGAVIVTDGRFADAPWPGAERLAGGLPVLWVPQGLDAPDARLVGLDVEPDGAGGLEVTATVAANRAMDARLVIRRQGRAEPLLSRRLALKPGSPAEVRVGDTPADAGSALYEARLTDADALAANNRLVALAPAQRPRLLWASGPDGPVGPPLGPTWQVERIAPDQLSAMAETLLGYSAVVVVARPDQPLSSPQRQALAAYVRSGGGLVWVGPPVQAGDALAAVLPLAEPNRLRRPLDVRVLLDASGSMGEPGEAGAARFDRARQAVLTLARRHLSDSDRLAVWTFDVVPTLRHAGSAGTEAAGALQAALADVWPAGGTALGPALGAALDPPVAEGAQGLLIVVSDLRTEPFDPSVFTARLRERGLQLAVAATGPTDADAPLARLVEAVDGPFVHSDDLAGLAEWFGRFVRRARGEGLIHRPVAVVPAEGVELPGPLPVAEAWYDAVSAGGAEVRAEVGNGSALLARRRVGAGRTVGLALPLAGGLNEQWRASPSAGELLAGAVRWVRVAGQDPRVSGELDASDDPPTLSVRAQRDGEPWNGLDLRAQWSTPDGLAGQAPLPAVGPGRYEAPLPLPAHAPARLRVLSVDGTVLWQRTLTGGYPGEYARIGVDAVALAALAERTGGRVVEPDELPAALAALAAPTRRDLSAGLLLSALALMLIDWLWTRPILAR